MQTQELASDTSRYILQVYVGALSLHYEALSVEASKQTTAEEIVSCIVERLGLTGNNYELAEVAGECKERRLSPQEKPVSVMLLWPMHSERDFNRFYLRETHSEVPWLDNYRIDNYGLDPQILRDFIPFLLQPENREYPDLCQLPDLNESTLLENLRQRFEAGHIYTYVGSILIAVNPFKFHPIYNPKYVRLYQNQRIGPILPPHIFAIADNAYYYMLKEKRNQCVVISGESGSGKTESTNFLLHHLTALSQKGSHGSGVEQTILSAGPVLEAFGNAKTAHNNNSSRFGKFIQVNYRENGMVQGAVVQKYLLEKSRIVSQGSYERNYHVFYYLLSGVSDQDREALHLLPPDKYNYLNPKHLTLENCDEKYEFSRLRQSMEMVGFSAEKQRRLFNVLSAVLLLGNVEFFPKKSTYHHDESVQVRNPDIVAIISELLKVKQETLLAALTSKRVKASGETLIMQYKLPEAIAARDALAKCLYGALFEWIVLQVNHALLNKDQTPHTGHSIGVLDIFGFEDFGLQNSFEQLCINYANEHLQYYFNLHVFKYEQKEYKREGIKWTDIEFLDNSGCLNLFVSKPTGLLCILDDLCNFPGATNETLLQKFNSVHKENPFYEKPQRKENAFIIKHYAGKVKYQVTEMREKNLDLMRQDIVSVLKNSSMAFVRELVGADPVAVFRWAILRAFFRGYFAFRFAGSKHRKERNDQSVNKMSAKSRYRQTNDSIVSKRLSNNLSNDNSTSNYLQQRSPTNYLSMNQTGRKSWSSFTFNNKNFPDGKLAYESNSNYSSNAKLSPSEIQYDKNKFLNKENKFERSSQDVMARASQIVMKNKSFRPRERPKKGLKNLQSVKTLTAGQNLTNNQTVKTRKQPLTVTAQFQNSLVALMETLNQANPFFIRCIKSNPNKIPNQFDDATVTRQLRYTGMLETVRIRRAGYNVRLTYEEFIQLYRILLPKGLISSQKDVRDFMNTMDLNKQHYQLGLTKIYMRESQKIRLDIKLHTNILDNIINIQRWFRSIIQRRKFISIRTATITIQSFWRMCLAQRQFLVRKQERAATIIQATWRMYVVRKWYTKLRNGVINIQAYARGKLTRVIFKNGLGAFKQKQQVRERSKLRSTQSLPVNERTIQTANESSDNFINRLTIKPHHSLDTDLDTFTTTSNANSNSFNSNYNLGNSNNNNNNNYINNSGSSSSNNSVNKKTIGDHPNLLSLSNRGGMFIPEDQGLYYNNNAFDQQKRDNMLDRTEKQIKKLLIATSTAMTSTISANNSNNNNNNNNNNNSSSTNSVFARQPPQLQRQKTDDVLDRPSRKHYDFGKAVTNYYDDGHENLGRFEPLGKAPIRRVDSGPSPIRRDSRHDVPMDSSLPDVDNPNFDIVFVGNSPMDSPKDQYQRGGGGFTQKNNSSRSSSNQSILHSEPRDFAPRSTDEDINLNYSQSQSVPNYQNISFGGSPCSPQLQQPSSLLSPSYSNVQYNTQPQQEINDEITHKGFYSTPIRKSSVILGTISEGVRDRDIELKLTTGKTRRLTKANLSEDCHSTEPSAVPSTSLHQKSSSGSNYQSAFLPIRRDIVNTDSLRRRNSDPTNKIPLLEVNRGNDMYQSSTNINIAGHRFRKLSRINKTDKCSSCGASDSFVNEGYRCLDCKVLVHTKCIQNGGIKSLNCGVKRSKLLRKTPEKSSYNDNSRTPQNSKFQQTREYTDSTDKIIRDAKELQLMQDFITQKICKMDNDGNSKPSSEVDTVFKQALREFKDNLVAQYSVAHKQNSDILNIKYRDLIANFEHVIETTCGKKADFPLTMAVNAFRGFMNEFMNSRETEKPKTKRNKKNKKRKAEEHTSYNGHTFQLTIINIATACEICQLFLLWPIERGLVCQNCRLTCHKKCYQKAATCNKISNNSGNNHSVLGAHLLNSKNSKLFGVQLTILCLAEGDVKIPTQIDQLITKIEMHGLYSEGIYRKSGVTSKIKELKMKMSEMKNDETSDIDYESYNVHVLTNVLKSFLREMPEPLLTFDRYDDFLRASDLSNEADRVHTLLSLIKKLPSAHHSLLERLIFHLALVAQREQYNRMSASSLAIVFAPCVLRTNRYVPAQDSLNDISRQTKCMETLITQKMLNVKSTLADIDTLDTAAHTATTRLSTLRSSKVFTPDDLTPSTSSAQSRADTEEMLLEGHIQEIKKEKALLTSTLPSLARASSDDDLLSTDLDGEGGSLDDLSNSKDTSCSLIDGKDSVDSLSSCGGSASGVGVVSDRVGNSKGLTTCSISNYHRHNHNSMDTGSLAEEPIDAAVSYNIRRQNIDYYHHKPAIRESQTIPAAPQGSQSQQKLTDRDAFLKSTLTGSASSSSGSVTSSKWSGSQQNLTHSMLTTANSLSSSRSDLQRQKPIVMRSISGGYEAQPASSHPPATALLSSSSSIQLLNSNNKDNVKDNNKNNRKSKRKTSVDDEPIMV